MIGFSKRARLDNVVGVSDGRWPAPLQLMLGVLEGARLRQFVPPWAICIVFLCGSCATHQPQIAPFPDSRPAPFTQQECDFYFEPNMVQGFRWLCPDVSTEERHELEYLFVAVMLRDYDEPSFAITENTQEAERYRFIFEYSFSNPTIIRIDVAEDGTSTSTLQTVTHKA